jgi:ATP-dependent Clp protease adaptor protein ClpS
MNQEIELQELIDQALNNNSWGCQIWNDDHNTMDYAVYVIAKILHYDMIRAQQCALLIHTKGKYIVKEGDIGEIKMIVDAFNEAGLTAELVKN